RQGPRLRAAERRPAHARRDLQRHRDTLQGNRGAVPLPRHAGRHGAAHHAPHRGQPEVMQLRAEQLEAHLAKTLAPVYTIHGDEPLLALEAAAAVRAAARAKGHAEREVLIVERGFDWSELRQATANLSLFG